MDQNENPRELEREIERATRLVSLTTFAARSSLQASNS